MARWREGEVRWPGGGRERGSTSLRSQGGETALEGEGLYWIVNHIVPFCGLKVFKFIFKIFS